MQRKTRLSATTIEARIRELTAKPLDPIRGEDRIDWLPSAQRAGAAVYRRIEAIALRGNCSQTDLEMLERLNESAAILGELLVSAEALESGVDPRL